MDTYHQHITSHQQFSTIQSLLLNEQSETDQHLGHQKEVFHNHLHPTNLVIGGLVLPTQLDHPYLEILHRSEYQGVHVVVNA